MNFCKYFLFKFPYFKSIFSCACRRSLLLRRPHCSRRLDNIWCISQHCNRHEILQFVTKFWPNFILSNLDRFWAKTKQIKGFMGISKRGSILTMFMPNLSNFSRYSQNDGYCRRFKLNLTKITMKITSNSYKIKKMIS